MECRVARIWDKDRPPRAGLGGAGALNGLKCLLSGMRTREPGLEDDLPFTPAMLLFLGTPSGH